VPLFVPTCIVFSTGGGKNNSFLLIEHVLFVGAGAVEFILCHAEVEIAFAEEKKIDLVWLFALHAESICL
jgi:hypothetical protein